MSRFISLAKGARAIVALVLCCILSPATRAQSSIDGFDPSSNSNIYASLVQPDGKIVIGGAFTGLQPHKSGPSLDRQRIARLNPDGTLDSAFYPGFNGDVLALALQSDGKLIVGGKFTQIAPPNSAKWEDCPGIARLNADGTWDTTFKPNPSGALLNTALVRAVAVQADGKILVGGGFTSIAGATRNYVARLNTNGSIDTTFDPNANNVVLSLAVLRSGKILIGGGFTKVGNTARLRIARFNADGSLDTTFTTAADNRVLVITEQADGGILVGGDFRNLTPTGGTDAFGHGFIGRLKSDGTLDNTFGTTASATVNAITIQVDGKILVGGRFVWFRATGSDVLTERRYIGRLNPDGTVDEDFSPRTSGEVSTIGIQSDNGIVIAGYFTSIFGNNAGGNVVRGRIARLLPDGSLDTNFTVDAGGQISVLVRQPDGKTIVAGSFRSIAGNSRSNIARLDATGTLDASFYPITDSSIVSAALQSDGKIIIGGSFTKIGSTDRTAIARLNADGSLDTGFNPKANGNVSAIAVQSDGKILIGGSFTTLQPNGATATTARNYMARLNADGTIDTTFNPNPSSQIFAITLQADGKILVGGSFLGFQPNATGGGVNMRYLARINTDGTIDTAFAPTPDNVVSVITIQPTDKKILIGGQFLSLRPTGATTSTTRLRIARLDTAGAIDTAFDPGANGFVAAIGALDDGRILLGGSFTAFQVSPGSTDVIRRTFFAWLDSSGALSAGREFSVDNQVAAISVEPGAKALIGGAFTAVNDPSGSTTPLSDHLLHLITDSATVDTAYRVRGPAIAGGSVGAIAFQPNGQLVVGGTFSSLAGGSSTNIARVLADGLIDTTFRTSFDGAVNAVLTIPERADAAAGSGPIAWLNADGSFRSAFGRAITSQFTGTVYTIAVQADGRLLVGGAFSTGNATVGSNLVRLNTDGTLDTTFTPSPSDAVNTIAVQADGRIVVGGGFTSIAGATRNRIARLNANGSIDTAFDPNANGAVVEIRLIGTDGKMLVGGAFGTFQPNGATASVGRAYLARLNSDGTVDATFTATPNNPVQAFAVQADGSIILGGAFTAIGNTVRNFLARVDANGTLDANYNPNANGNVYTLALQADEKLLVGGSFGTFQPNGATEATVQIFFGRLNKDGTLDTTFKPGPGGTINSISLQSDGSMVVGGAFTSFSPNGTSTIISRNGIARVKADGSIDTSFNPNASSTVEVVQTRPDGSILVGGAFSSLHPTATLLVGGSFATVDGSAVANLVRLSSDGTADVNYNPAPNGAVRALAMLTDGRMLVAGDFTTLGGVAHQRLARLDTDGSVDPTFVPQIDGAVFALSLQPDGRILIGGDFAIVGGASHPRVARLAADGTLDATFNATVDDRVTAVVAQADGRILISGRFTSVNGAGRSRIARLEANGTTNAGFNPGANGSVWSLGLQADGRILVGGAFTQVAGASRSRLARLLADGTLDTAFTIETDGDVLAIAPRSDGRPTIGGQFTTVGGLSRNLVARLPTTTPATQNLAVNAGLSQLTWTRGGPAGEFASVTFSYSTDAATWSNLGNATRTGATGVWQLAGLSLPANTLYYVRARSVSLVSQYASSSFVDSVWQFYGTIPAGKSSVSASSDTSSDSGDGSTSGTGDGSGTPSGSGNSSSGDGSSSSGSGSGSGSGSNISTLGSNNLVNLSVRVQIGAVDPLITGFIVSGSAPQQVLVRAVGPGLGAFGVNGTMTAPQLTLFDGAGHMIETHAAWGGDPALSTTFSAVSAFPLDPASADSAMVATLAPGSYTIHARDGVAPGGIVLAEIYVASEGGGLANLSARGPVGTGVAVFIGGFVVGGDAPRKVLIRGVGPGLAQFGVGDAIADPSIKVFNAESAIVAQNDDWGAQSAADAAATSAAIGASRAFALGAGSKDSALVVTLPPGAYTIHLSGTTAGSALVEVYEVP